MALHQSEDNKEQNDNTMIFERELLMISLTDDSIPTFRKAHFLKPLLNTTNNQPLPKPPLSFSSNPNILDKLIPKISFKGIKCPRMSWKTWVENLEKTHQSIWKKVGIYGAIKASTYTINIDIELIMHLAQKFCVETNTFIFPWGECTITLEDIMILGGFSVIGDSVLSPLENRSSEEIKMLGILEKSCVAIKRKCFGDLAVYGWVNYFEGKGGELEHVAFLVFWLSWYVFPTDLTEIDTNVFALAIRLVKGTRIALASAVLASVYRDLSLLKGKIVAVNNKDGIHGSSLDLWSLLQLVQVWVWERFPAMSPKPFSLVCGEPRIARWHNVHTVKNDNSRLNMDFGEELFLWRPYGLYLKNWEFPKFCSDEELSVVIDSRVDDELLSFARCLRDCELVGLDCVEHYQPHRVGMQFGLDQDIPDFVPRKNSNLDLDGIQCYVPTRLLEGDVTVRYLKWWRGESIPCAEALFASPIQKCHLNKRNILFKALRPHIYPSRPCSESMEVDLMSCKETSKGEFAPFENMASQSYLSLIPENVMEDGRNTEHYTVPECSPVTGNKSECFKTNHSQSHISSLVFVQDAALVNALLPGSETDKSAEVVVATEEKSADNPIESICNEFEERISRLERMILTLMAAKFRSK